MLQSSLSHQPVLVTGAAGFVGSQLVEGLLEVGAQVHALVRPGGNYWRLQEFKDNPHFHLHPVDLQNLTVVTRAVQKIKPTYIYHLATSGAYHWQDDPTKIFATNVEGTLHLLQALATISYRLMVNVGSSSEYGPKKQPMKESDTLEPISFYAVAKATQTLICQAEARVKHLPIVTVRFFTVYGPKEDSRKIIPTLLQAVQAGRPVTLADPASAHDYIYVGDVVAALLSVDRLQKHTGQIFNLGSSQQTTLQSLVDLVGSVTQQQTQAHWGAYPSHRWDSQMWVADISQAERWLKWRPTTSLVAGLARTWKWIQEVGYAKDKSTGSGRRHSLPTL